MLVVLFHIRTRVIGGYIGVDVFFVISGYLISSSIIAEMAAGTFTIVSFYERRIRRIFPALLVMLLVTTAFVYNNLAPAETESYAKSLLAALFSLSNIFFAHQTGYFGGASGLQPLLHTWSLAVEEQFYVFFPIMLIVVQKFAPRNLKTVVWTITGVCFLSACIWVRSDPISAFFFAPLRAWELLVGTIVSQRYLPAIQGKALRNVASVTGLLLILVPGFTYTSNTVFPGLNALPPCIGAALIIAAGENGTSIVGSILGWRPIVFVGLISYSLYLWHWPVLVLQGTSFLFMDRPGDSKAPRALVLIISLLLATISWRFIETPFRKGHFRPNRKTLFHLTSGITAFMTIIGIFTITKQGLPYRFSAKEIRVSSYINYEPTNEWRERSCFLLQEGSFDRFTHSNCLQDNPSLKHYLIFGDSLAAQLYPGLSDVFTNINFSQATVAACPPFLPNSEPRLITTVSINCTTMAKYIFGDYLVHHPVDTVILGGDWKVGDLTRLAQTVYWIKQRGMRVIVFGPTNMYDQSLPRLLFNSIRNNNFKYLANHSLREDRQFDRTWANEARTQWKVPYISLYEDLCFLPGTEEHSSNEIVGGCPVYADDGSPLLFDNHHLTVSGSLQYARSIKRLQQLP